MKSIFMSMAGFVAGMLEASVRIAEGIAYAFWHPIKTLQGISYAIWHWDQVAKHLWTEITTAYIEMVLYGNDFPAGKFYGEMTVEVLASVFTISKAKQVAGAGHASKLLPSAVLGGKVAQGSGFLSLGSLTGFIGNISSRVKTFFNQLRDGLKKHGDEAVEGTNLRISYSEVFEKELINFNDGYIIGYVVEEDLFLVQYHGGNGSLKYWTTTGQANSFSTVDEVMESLALLPEWGQRSMVSVAKIPAGTEVKYAFGTAVEQSSKITGQTVTGGGLQYLFEEFDPNWILETRLIP